MKYDSIVNTQTLESFYNRSSNSIEIADAYYKAKLYSAASSFYNVRLNEILNTENFEEKSYCLMQMARCYMDQQRDNKHSNWQLTIINNLLNDAIVLCHKNYNAWYYMGKYYMLANNDKGAYYSYTYILMNLLDDVKPNDYEKIFNMVFDTFDIAEYHMVIKYEYFFKKVLQWSISKLDLEHTQKIMDRIKEHNDKVTEIEHTIMEHKIVS